MFLRPFLRKLRKPLRFGFYGAIGCLIAALLLGELLLHLTYLPPTVEKLPQAIALLIDCSGSMSSEKLTEVKTAATAFVRRQDLSQDRFAAIGFGSRVHIGTPLTSDLRTLEKAIANLDDGGGTKMDLGLQAATAQLPASNFQRHILLFTDGIPSSPTQTSRIAQSSRNQGINLVAVATGDADIDFLTQVTGDRNLVFYASSGQFDRAFQDAEKVIYGKQLVESEATGNYSLVSGTLRISGWTGILAVGVALALIVGQNYYQRRRRLLTPTEGTLSTVKSFIAGLIAGAVGQGAFLGGPLLFSSLASIPTLEVVARILGWTILGCLVGGGISFVPNLQVRRALFGGSLGGILGGIGFLVAASILGDLPGRLAGVAILGFCIGIMIFLAEQDQLRQAAYLLVKWTDTEQRKILLGKRPIVLGFADEADIYLRKDQGYTPVTAKIYQEEDRIVMEFDQGYAQSRGIKVMKQELSNGARRKLGDVILEVRTSEEQGTGNEEQ